MIVKVFDSKGEEKKTVYVDRMTDVSTAMFAIMQVFEEQIKVDELVAKNNELQEKVEELEEYKYDVERTLEDTNFDNVTELRDAYDDACTVLSDIHESTRGY